VRAAPARESLCALLPALAAYSRGTALAEATEFIREFIRVLRPNPMIIVARVHEEKEHATEMPGPD